MFKTNRKTGQVFNDDKKRSDSHHGSVRPKTGVKTNGMKGNRESSKVYLNNDKIETIHSFDHMALYKMKNLKTEPEIGGKKVVLDFYVKAEDFYDATGDEVFKNKPIYYQLWMIPRKNYLNEETLNKIDEDLSDNVGVNQDTIAEAMIDYGNAIPTGIRKEGTWKQEKEILESMRKEAEPISSLIGFYLDKPWNGMGETGWDSLREVIK